METPSACPEIDFLERYASGRTSDAEAQRLEEHLKGCSFCIARLATLGEGDGLMQALRAQKDKPPAEGGLDRLQEHLRNLGPPTVTMLVSETDSSSPDATPPPGDSLVADEDLRSLLAPGQRPDEIGRLGPYRVLRVLGAGGMGIVFEAEDPQLQRRVALKAVRPALAANSAARQRFLREARRMAALSHDHILGIHHAGEDHGVFFLVMPLLQGETLEERLKREGQLPLAEVLRIGRETAQGLAAAHERGVIHRDVKPPNLWLEAPAGRVKILDFGLARLAEGDMALTGSFTLLGTPTYMAPEQSEGATDARADLFSLGCVLYRMTTGQLAFPGKSLAAVLHALHSLHPTPARQINPQVPARLSQLIERLLAKDRADRPAAAAAVVRELEEIEKAVRITPPDGTAEAIDERPQPTVVAPMPRRPRWRRLAALSLLLAGTLAVTAVVLWPRSSPPADSAPTAPRLQIVRLDVRHYPTVNGHRDHRGSKLGRDSYGTNVNDGVEVETELSQPAYAFLIAFRPDGTDALCFPSKPDEAPPRLERFPPGSTGYDLTEGEGLHAFAVVASSKPLPSFRKWWSRQGCPWQKRPAPPDVVWRTFDGRHVESLTAVPGGERGLKEVQGKAEVARLWEWLKQRPPVEAVAVLGFAVMPKEEP